MFLANNHLIRGFPIYTVQPYVIRNEYIFNSMALEIIHANSEVTDNGLLNFKQRFKQYVTMLECQISVTQF